MLAIEARNDGGPFEFVVQTEADLANVLNPKIGQFALALDAGSIWFHTGSIWQEIANSSGVSFTISRGGTLFNDGGLTTGANIIVWRAPYAATVINVRGFRVGGTGATINARRNGADNFLSSNLSLTSANDWIDGGAVQNVAVVAGDEIEIMIVTVAGSPTQVAVQIDMTRSP